MRDEASQARVARRLQANLAGQAAVARTRALGRVPEGSGPEIPDAPARGPVRQFMPMKAYPDGEDGHKVKPAGYMGRKAIVHADAFDIMRSRAASKGKPDPFTPAQVVMGRQYAALFEKHQNAGMRCSSFEAMPQGGGGTGGEYIDAVLRDRERLGVLLSRIGNGAAKVVRRQKPSERGSKKNISDLRLVHAVCVEEKAMTLILKDHGWGNRGEAIEALTMALRDALDRMAGPLVRPRGGAVMYGAGVSSPFA
ncbi:MAG: hypothetical protein COB08_000800 [Rhodobacteraceae bacterium]|nr:hypothetical protein [Paracoccaceae bacterium]